MKGRNARRGAACCALISSVLEGAACCAPTAAAIATVVLGLSFLSACSTEKSPDVPTILAADPPSMAIGESITATVTSSEAFFDGDLEAAITSDGALALESLHRQDALTAIAVFTSTEDTAIGPHRFTLEMGGETATLDISVLAEPDGTGGDIGIGGDTATAGAYMATMTVDGQGTLFDALCTVEVDGADGMEIQFVDVRTETSIEVTYSIDLSQAPVVATVRVVDGPRQYEAPFTIVSPAEHTSTVAGQALTKGRVGTVTLANGAASLHAGTRFDLTDLSDVEAGETQVVDATEAAIPVRVPFDYDGDELDLVAHTYGQGGAVLELMHVTVRLLEPAYLAAVPSRLADTVGEQTVDLVAQGLDLTAIDDITPQEDDHVVLSGWTATNATTGTASFVLDSSAAEGGYVLAADDGAREIFGVVAVTGFGNNALEAEVDVFAGDHILTAITVYGGDLLETDLALDGSTDIEVIDFVYIDEGCVVVELAVDPLASDGVETLTLSSNGEDYDVHWWIHESGI